MLGNMGRDWHMRNIESIGQKWQHCPRCNQSGFVVGSGCAICGFPLTGRDLPIKKRTSLSGLSWFRIGAWTSAVAGVVAVVMVLWV